MWDYSMGFDGIRWDSMGDLKLLALGHFKEVRPFPSQKEIREPKCFLIA